MLKHVFVFLLVSSFLSYSQVSKLQIKGDQLLKNNKYAQAVAYFESIDSATRSQDILYDYYMGMSYYYSLDKKGNSIVHFENYLISADANQINYRNHGHVHYILGRMYHLTYDFDNASKKYKDYIDYVTENANIPNREKKEIIESVEREIEQCKYGEIALKNPRNVIIENLGDSINSIYPDYAAVVSQDERMLIFTSRRADSRGGKKTPDQGYYEDIYKADLAKGSLFGGRSISPDSLRSSYYSLVTDFEYENFQNMGSKVNTNGHDAGIQLGQGDSVLYFYKDSDIWSINLYDSINIKPKKLGVIINSNEHEPSLFFSYDGSKLFIVSDREGGYGGLDLYVSERQSDNSYGEAKNLGPKINTEFDEDAPYLDPDGQTLYFSSTGHSSMGGYDIFRTKIQGNGWSDPVNLGYPINTTSDDIYFTMTSRYNRGYYSSGKLEGKGDMDLYRITFSDERDPVAELIGFVKRGEDLVPAKSVITMTSIDKTEEISHATDSIKGDYFLLLGHGKEYDMTVETEGFAPYVRRFEIPEQKEYFQLYQEVHHVHLFDSFGNIIGQKITVFNAMGGADSTVTLYGDRAKKELDLMKIDVDYEGNINKLTDVKFYISEDSLANLMLIDSALNFYFDAYTNVSFIDGPDKYDTDNYKEFEKTLDRDDFLNNVKKKINEDLDSKNESQLSYEGSTNVTKIGGLFYTVQIGVYDNPKTPGMIANIKPLNVELNENGQKRYTSGRFTSIESAEIKRIELVRQNITDAYITAYYKGKRISIMESKVLLKSKGDSVLYDPSKE